MKKLRLAVCSVKVSTPHFCCETCGFDFSRNPDTPHGTVTGRGARKGELYRWFSCWCSCGGIEIAAEDGVGAIAIYHHSWCAKDACDRRGYERYRECALLEQRARAQLELFPSAKSAGGAR